MRQEASFLPNFQLKAVSAASKILTIQLQPLKYSPCECSLYNPPYMSAASKILPMHVTIVRHRPLCFHSTEIKPATMFPEEQMSSHAGQLGRCWCEHRYNADRKQRQSVGEPIMGRAAGEGLETPVFLCRATLGYMINF